MPISAVPRGSAGSSTSLGRSTFLVVHVEGGNIRGVYPYSDRAEAERFADDLWAEADEGVDDVRMFAFVEGVKVDYLPQVYMPDSEGAQS